MFKVLLLLLHALVSACRNRADLVLEILALRQQLAAFALSGRRPRVTITDRWARWSDVLIFVKPETVIRWHRAGLPALLDLALASTRKTRAATDGPECPRPDPTNGDGEFYLGRATVAIPRGAMVRPAFHAGYCITSCK